MYSQPNSILTPPPIQVKINKLLDNLKTITDTLSILCIRNNLADYYIEQGSYYHALSYLNKNIELSEQTKRKHAGCIAETHLLLCKTYDRLLHIEPILKHIKLYDYYINLAYPNKPIYKANYYMYLSRYYNLQFSIEKALINSSKSIEIAKSNPADIGLIPLYHIYNSHLFSLRNNPYSYKNKSDLREKVYALLAKEFKEYTTEKTVQTISSNMFEYDSLINFSQDTSNNLEKKIKSPLFLKFNQLLDKEIQHVNAYVGFYNPYSSRFNILKGLLYFSYNDYDSAIHYCDLALEQIIGGEEISKEIWCTSNSIVISAYILKSRCIDRLYRQYHHLELLYENEQLLAKAAKAWQIYIEDQMEYNTLFNSNIYITNPFPNMQKNYIELYARTKKEIYKTHIFESGSLAKHYSLVLSLNKKFHSKTSENKDENYLLYEQHIQNLNTPHQHTIKTTLPNPTPHLNLTNTFNDIRSNLNLNEAVVSYNVVKIKNKAYVYVQIIENKKDTLLQLPFNLSTPNEPKESENPIIEAIKNNDIPSFKRESLYLFQQLWEPVQSILSKQINSILLYQDPIIENLNIPFELLISTETTANNFKIIEYLNKKYSISYPITSFTGLNIKSSKTPKEIVLIIAENDSLNSFIYASKFAENISKKFKTKIISGNESSKENFKKTLKTASVVILVSHGNGNRSEDGTEKGLFFSDGFLSLTEINQLNSNCELLVLAGCSTGKGYRSQEGNINLAHAFTYAGVKSTLISDWDIDEKPSLMILENWLVFLSQGYSKSEALSMAQQQFLKNASNRLSNPIYWSAYRIIGSNNAIFIQAKSQKSNWMVYGSLTFVAYLFFVYVFYINKKHKKLN